MKDWETTPAPGEDKIPPATEVKRWDVDRAGVVIAGSIFGDHDSSVQLIRVAKMCGWEESAADELIITKAFQGGNFTDKEDLQWVDILNEIEDWLTENVAPEEYRFGWDEGDFRLESDETWCGWYEVRCYELSHAHHPKHVAKA